MLSIFGVNIRDDLLKEPVSFIRNTKTPQKTVVRNTYDIFGHDFFFLRQHIKTVAVVAVVAVIPWYDPDVFARLFNCYSHSIGVKVISFSKIWEGEETVNSFKSQHKG